MAKGAALALWLTDLISPELQTTKGGGGEEQAQHKNTFQIKEGDKTILEHGIVLRSSDDQQHLQTKNQQ